MRDMQIKATVRDHFTPTRMTKLKRTDSTAFGEDVETLELSYNAGGMESSEVAVANTLVVPHSVKHKVATYPSSSHPHICPRELDTCVTQKFVHKCSQQHYP